MGHLLEFLLANNMIKFLLTFGFIAVCSAAHDNAFARLFDDLFDDAGYDPKIIPMEKPAAGNGNNAVNLGLGLSLLNIGLDDVGNLDVNAWLRASWKDYRLMWDPAQYEGIKSINVPAQDIWRPDISVYNEISLEAGGLASTLADSTYLAVVKNDGTVIWIPPVNFEVGCNGKGEDGEMITLEDIDDQFKQNFMTALQSPTSLLTTGSRLKWLTLSTKKESNSSVVEVEQIILSVEVNQIISSTME